MNDLYRKSKIGFLWTFTGNVGKAAFGLATLIVLTYMLPPAELGLVSIIMVVYGLSETIAQFGLSQSIIGRKGVTANELSSIFWVNVLIGFAVFGLTWLLAPWLAGFYAHEELVGLIRLMGAIFLIEPWSLVFKAVLEKELRFPIGEKVFITRHAVQAIAVIAFLFAGYGVTGYVYGTLIASASVVPLFFLVFARHGWWLPGFHLRLAEVRAHYAFGVYVTGKEFVNFLGRNLDELLVGRVFGLETLGIYFFAKKIIERPTQAFSSPFSRVTFPFFAALRDDAERLAKAYFGLTRIVASLGFMAAGFALILAPAVIGLVFGPTYAAADSLIRIFILASFFQILLVGFGTPILYALQRPGVVFMIDLAVTSAKCVAVFVAALYSIEAVALTVLIATALKLVVIQVFANRYLGTAWREYLAHVMRPLAHSLIALAISLIPFIVTGAAHPYMSALIFLIAGSAVILVYDPDTVSRIRSLTP